MRFLLTSAGVQNSSIHDALVDLLGKPIAESSAFCIPTAVYAMPGGAAHAWRFLSGQANTPMCELGWKSLGVLELTYRTASNLSARIRLHQEFSTKANSILQPYNSPTPHAPDKCGHSRTLSGRLPQGRIRRLVA